MMDCGKPCTIYAAIFHSNFVSLPNFLVGFPWASFVLSSLAYIFVVVFFLGYGRVVMCHFGHLF